MNFNSKLSNPLQCPVCKDFLIKSSTFYYCEHNHHFDQSKKGYTNFLLANQKRSSNPGDSKEMVQARFDFLNKGYYQPIAAAINNCLQDFIAHSSSPAFTVVDSGCGVGYYLNFISKNHQRSLELWGIDISKEAIKKAASAYANSANWFVSSMKDLPFINESVDCVLSVFAPLQASEINRILKKNGFLLTVTPAANHLIECRKQLFDQVRQIDRRKIENKLEKEFSLIKFIPICYKIKIERGDVSNLLKMTPYYWKSDPKQQKALQSSTEMAVTIDMALCLFHKKLY